jgi:hypothetical protein
LATPLPIVTGPEALRPTLSRGLPFSHLSFLSAQKQETFRIILLKTQKNGLLGNG